MPLSDTEKPIEGKVVRNVLTEEMTLEKNGYTRSIWTNRLGKSEEIGRERIEVIKKKVQRISKRG
jgi:hypothetical protein